MYNQFFTIKPRISEKNGGSKVVHLIYIYIYIYNLFILYILGVVKRNPLFVHSISCKMMDFFLLNLICIFVCWFIFLCSNINVISSSSSGLLLRFLSNRLWMWLTSSSCICWTVSINPSNTPLNCAMTSVVPFLEQKNKIWN